MGLVDKIIPENKVIPIMVTHDMHPASYQVNSVIMLYEGKNDANAEITRQYALWR